MKVQRTDDQNIYIATTDGVALWALGIVEFRVDIRYRKFIFTPVYRDRSEDPVFEAAGGWEALMHDIEKERRRGITEKLKRLNDEHFERMASKIYGVGQAFWTAIRKNVRDRDQLSRIEKDVCGERARWSAAHRHRAPLRSAGGLAADGLATTAVRRYG